jgi:hypothetical protein
VRGQDDPPLRGPGFGRPVRLLPVQPPLDPPYVDNPAVRMQKSEESRRTSGVEIEALLRRLEGGVRPEESETWELVEAPAIEA